MAKLIRIVYWSRHCFNGYYGTFIWCEKYICPWVDSVHNMEKLLLCKLRLRYLFTVYVRINYLIHIIYFTILLHLHQSWFEQVLAVISEQHTELCFLPFLKQAYFLFLPGHFMKTSLCFRHLNIVKFLNFTGLKKFCPT